MRTFGRLSYTNPYQLINETARYRRERQRLVKEVTEYNPDKHHITMQLATREAVYGERSDDGGLGEEFDEDY